MVEDDVAVSDVIAEALTQSNYDARVAPTASDALASAEIERPDLILLDISLPDVPIIMLTANADEQLARETLRRGAFDYVMKPVNLDELIRIVEFALASG